jgi:hypothetical protein
MAGEVTGTVGSPLDPMSTKAQAPAAAAAITPAPATVRPAGASRSHGRRRDRGVSCGGPRGVLGGGLGVCTAAEGTSETGNSDSAKADVRFTAASRYAANRYSSKKSSTSARASAESAGAGSSAKTRAADTLRGRLGPQTPHSVACPSTRSRSGGVIVPAQLRTISARSGQARPSRRIRISAPRARSRLCRARLSNAWASSAQRPSVTPRSTSCLQLRSSASRSSAAMFITALHAISRDSASRWPGGAGGSSARDSWTARRLPHSVRASE